MNTNYDSIIVGGGPAGCRAAMVIAGRGWNTLVVDRSIKQGYLASLQCVHDFPGVLEALSGEELLGYMRKQTDHCGAHFLIDAVTSMRAEKKPMTIMTDNGRELYARSIVIATGAAKRCHNLRDEKKWLGKGVYYDITLDAQYVCQKPTAIVGKDTHMIEAAQYLSGIVSQLYVIIPSNKVDCDMALIQDLQKKSHVEILYSSSITDMMGDAHLEGIHVLQSGKQVELAVNGLFNYLYSNQASASFANDGIERAENKGIKVDERLMSSVQGVWACGDILCAQPQSIIVSAAQGHIAGLAVDDYLRK